MIALGVVVVLLFSSAAARGANRIQIENARPGTFAWASIRPTAEIEGFADQASVTPGGVLGLHVGGDPAAAPRYRIDFYRLGWYTGAGGRLLACLPLCGGDRETIARPALPTPDPQTGEARAGWPLTDTLNVPADWLSGYYEARIVVTAGRAAGQAHPVYFVVQERLRRSPILVQVPVNTWQAYNNWAGKSLYNFNSTGGLRANHVSFDRPYALPPVPGAQATPLPWEIQLVRFLEREGYEVSYQTDVDTDRNPGSLLQHRLVMTAGHSEYWTMTMREGFDTARDLGTNLAFIGSNNAYWHVRYKDDRRTLVGYKAWGDPIADPAQKTVLFRDLGRPECALIGVMHLDSLGRTDYAVNPATLDDPWFANTGLTASSTPALAQLVVGRHAQRVADDRHLPPVRVLRAALRPAVADHRPDHSGKSAVELAQEVADEVRGRGEPDVAVHQAASVGEVGRRLAAD